MSENLALFGGKQLVDDPAKLRVRWPIVEESDIEAVVKVLRSGNFTELHDRSEIIKFEAELAAYLGVSHCVAMNSGTSALHAALAAIGLEPGDEVILPALTFIATATAILAHQGIPVFADVDTNTYNIDPAHVETLINPRTRAIIAVHLHGLPADMDRLKAICNKYGIYLIEDASQAIGAEYKEEKIGSIGDIAAASLMAGKNLASAGEAGFISTKSLELRNRADAIKCFGETISEGTERTYCHETLGFNYRAVPLVIAFARKQLERQDTYTAFRIKMGSYINERLSYYPGLTPPSVPSGSTHVYHIYRFRLNPKGMGLDLPALAIRRAFQQIFQAEGVPLCTYLNAPLPASKIFSQYKFYGKMCPWKCSSNNLPSYDLRNYPATIDVINSTLTFGPSLHASHLSQKTAEIYLTCFDKAFSNFDQIASLAKDIAQQLEKSEHDTYI